ncbi:MAG: hypothetical protein U0271_00660 [Polyangiaceae bacterium]
MTAASTHTGYAKLGSDKHFLLRRRGRLLPIVVVPDFMGTRLTEPEGQKIIWNPTGFPMSFLGASGPPVGRGKRDRPIVTPGPFACDWERLQQVSAALEPDTSHKFQSEQERTAVARVANYYHLVTAYYDKLVRGLAGHEGDEKWLATGDAEKLGIEPRVYCCGYDWRQDNAKSALALADVVARALEETKESKCIIVAHGMGGNIARYYSRVLGGESRVFAMFLVGTPILGAPTAYSQLKHGIPGVYLRDYFHGEFEEDHEETVADEAATLATTALAAATTMASNPAGAAQGLFGTLYWILTIGAGKMLTRKETIYFARQLPSAYEMMPNAIFCNKQRYWLFFDVLLTARPPNGYLITFPTMLDVGMVLTQPGMTTLAPAATLLSSQISAAVEASRQRAAERRSNAKLISANSAPIQDVFIHIAESFDDGDSIARLGAQVKALIDIVTKSFFDCRNARALYTDIFTGLLDVVDLRAISRANVNLALSFHDALTLHPKEEKRGLIPFLKSVFAPVRAAPAAQPVNHALTKEEQAENERQVNEPIEREIETPHPRAYIHPRTISYYVNDLPTDGGSILMCLEMYSNYDANVAKWQLLPSLVGMTMGAPSESTEPSALYWGDGVVPLFSSKPPEDLISVPLDSKSRAFSQFAHTSMMNEDDVVNALKDDIKALQAEWMKAV